MASESGVARPPLSLSRRTCELLVDMVGCDGWPILVEGCGFEDRFMSTSIRPQSELAVCRGSSLIEMVVGIEFGWRIMCCGLTKSMEEGEQDGEVTSNLGATVQVRKMHAE